MSTVGVAELSLQPGVKIPDVVVGSPAERAGLRSGDIVLAIDGEQIPPVFSSVPTVMREIRCGP